MAIRYAPGSVVGGRFRVLRVLAIGGMGSVYDVEDVALGRSFVLKTLHVELATQGDLRRQMDREARVLGRVDHANIVRVFTAGVTADDLPFIVMEKLEGASLREVLRTFGKPPMRATVRAVIDLLLALDHVHELGIVHCDVKPENIFLHQERSRVVPKLLDFGVVRVLARGEANARLGGTVRYASPEQLRGEAVTPRSDVYSMALVLYEMLAGRSAFHDVAGADVGEAQLTRTPPCIAGVPSGLMRMVLDALSKDATRRPHDAFSFARALKDVEGFLGDDKSLAHAVNVTRACVDETTRRRDSGDEPTHTNDTIVELPMAISNDDLLTRYASASGPDGGGGRCDGFRP
jgi:serine/threonine protein kinase